ncbi:hypothetical protein [Helicobacter sp. 11S02596-1]|uniref:hypothetical protein n=1 Tax=Helicobacter sp. 11S02596-1 TaxID=1476194 RepID=UPI000BA72E0F|nr:hypothetical protein [Helicobacter sp. 11S02596-1]PAF41288.1 hypothetical protein BJI48_08865 [Helicobacter sp. 11S02596-1]
MTVILENVGNELLPALKSLAAGANLKMKTKRSDDEIVATLRKESQQLKADYKAGKIKGYDSAEEMEEAILNGNKI